MASPSEVILLWRQELRARCACLMTARCPAVPPVAARAPRLQLPAPSIRRAVVAPAGRRSGRRCAAAARDDEAEAERLSVEAARREPRLLAPVELLRGRLLLRRGRSMPRSPLFRAGLRITPAAPLLQVSLGHALMLQGRYRGGLGGAGVRGGGSISARRPGSRPCPARNGRARNSPARCWCMPSRAWATASCSPATCRPSRGGSGGVVLVCHRPLVPLLATLQGVAEALPMGDVTVEFDRWVLLGSVPAAVRHHARDHPVRRRLPAARPRPPRRLGEPPAGGPRAWAWSGPAIPTRRRMPAARSRSRRSGRCSTCRASASSACRSGPPPRRRGQPGILDLAPDLTDFAETAAARGRARPGGQRRYRGRPSRRRARPALLAALPDPPDWRWLLGREDSPWYASLRLFRQARPGRLGARRSRAMAALAGKVGVNRGRHCSPCIRLRVVLAKRGR